MAREGGSAVIVIRGEAGVGKTALLDYAVARAGGLRVLRARGGELEADQRFAALAELCRPLLGRLARLPEARAAALASAFGLHSPACVVDRYAVYAGTLDLLTAAAEEENPLLVVVDDAHLLDDASAEGVAFIARRLRTDGVALVIGTESEDDFPHAEELRLGPLDPAHVRALLATRFRGELAPPVVERIVEQRATEPARAARDRTRPAAAAAHRGTPLDRSWRPPRSGCTCAASRRSRRTRGRRYCWRRSPRAATTRPSRAHVRRSTSTRRYSSPPSGQGSSSRARRACCSATSWRAPPFPTRP